MRLKLGLIAFGMIFLLLLGLRPDALPYLRAARYSDAALAHWPNALYFRQSVLERSMFPLWRETTMAGQPFAANPLNKTAYPPQWLVLLFPPALHLNLLILLHFLLAGGGLWVWARSIGLGPEAAAFSAAAYVFAPRLLGHLGAGHLDILYAMAWWPWLMWSVRQTAIGVPKSILTSALIAALVFLADLRVSLFAFGVAALYVIVELYRAQAWRRIGWFAIVSLLFALMTAAVIVPLLLWQPYTTRSALTLTDAGVLALQPVHLLSLILPAPPPSIETLTYLGLPVLALAGIGITSFTRGIRLGLLGAILFTFLYALGSNGFLWPLLVKWFPSLLWFRVPSRAWLILTLLLPLVAGFGLQALLARLEMMRDDKTTPTLKYLRLIIVVGMAVMLVLGVFALLVLRLPTASAIPPIAGGLALGGLLLAVLNRRSQPRQLTLILIALSCLDLAWTGYQWTTWRGVETWLDPGRSLAERLVEANADRVYSPTYSLEQQVAEVYGLRLFGGVDPFQLAGMVEAVSRGGGVPIMQYSPVLPPLAGAASDSDVAQANRDALINTEVLAEWDVSHIVVAYPINHPRLEYRDTIGGVEVYTNLDYKPPPETRMIPDWPEGWPGLPDPTTVQTLNQITLTVAFMSGTSFFICAALLLFFILRSKRG